MARWADLQWAGELRNEGHDKEPRFGIEDVRKQTGGEDPSERLPLRWDKRDQVASCDRLVAQPYQVGGSYTFYNPKVDRRG